MTEITMEVPAALDAQLLNSGCFCISLDNAALRRALETELGTPGMATLVAERCPYVFSTRPVFVSAAHARAMEQLIDAIESVIALPAYRETVLADAPPIARHDPGAKGVFFGYDFHVEPGGIGLIEINTNAGGAMLNAVLARAQRACCGEVEDMLPRPESIAKFEDGIVDMFRSEWRHAGRTQPLRTIAIVDATPEQQYLYPEFLLFQQLFGRHGIDAHIADPTDLTWRDGALWLGETQIDMVYNRLTDFMLEAPASAALRAAYLADAAVIAPHPHAHALYADKRNLALLTDDARLQELGVPKATRDLLLSGIPRTRVVTPAIAEQLWSERRRLFFKPMAGFGGRAAYRGDKLTKRVWEEIVAGEYVAQEIVAPGERVIDMSDEEQVLKFDLRNYVYEGAVQSTAARLYQGQTTNFRTPGGGFAPVYRLPDDAASSVTASSGASRPPCACS